MSTNIRCCKITSIDLCSLILLALSELLSCIFLSCRGRTGAANKPEKSSKPSDKGTKLQLPARKSEQDCCPKTVQTAEGKTITKALKVTYVVR